MTSESTPASAAARSSGPGYVGRANLDRTRRDRSLSMAEDDDTLPS